MLPLRVSNAMAGKVARGRHSVTHANGIAQPVSGVTGVGADAGAAASQAESYTTVASKLGKPR